MCWFFGEGGCGCGVPHFTRRIEQRSCLGMGPAAPGVLLPRERSVQGKESLQQAAHAQTVLAVQYTANQRCLMRGGLVRAQGYCMSNA